MRLRRPTRLVHWIALVALWFAALAPTVSHALVASQPGLLNDICAVAGVSADATGPQPDRSRDAAGGWLDHCPMCLLQAHAPALPGATQTVALDDRRAFDVPRLFLHAGRTLHAWASAQARAPPALS